MLPSKGLTSVMIIIIIIIPIKRDKFYDMSRNESIVKFSCNKPREPGELITRSRNNYVAIYFINVIKQSGPELITRLLKYHVSSRIAENQFKHFSGKPNLEKGHSCGTT